MPCRARQTCSAASVTPLFSPPRQRHAVTGTRSGAAEEEVGGIYGISVGLLSAGLPSPRRCKLVSGMGKEQELLEAARTGNVALVEKLLSGKKGLLGSGSGSIPLPSLLR